VTETPPVPSRDAYVSIENHAGWAEVRLDRAERRNALSWDLVGDLVAALESAAASTPVVVLSAAGPTFCAGGDRHDAEAGRRAPLEELVTAMNGCPSFVIARVHGDVHGGGLALLTACPVVICSSTASFVLPAAADRDVFPDGFFSYIGGDAAGRRLVEFGLRSVPISAERAAGMGLVTSVVPPELLDREVSAWVSDAVARPGATGGARRYWQDRINGQLGRGPAPRPQSGPGSPARPPRSEDAAG